MTYSIGDIEDLTGIKAHILRYWEDVVPGFSPKKNLTGRREYSQHDVDLIYRLNYLINERNFSTEAAGNQILEDSKAVEKCPELLQQIKETRALLTKFYIELKNHKQ